MKSIEPLPKHKDGNQSLLAKVNELVEQVNQLTIAYEAHDHDVNLDQIGTAETSLPPLIEELQARHD